MLAGQIESSIKDARWEAHEYGWIDTVEIFNPGDDVHLSRDIDPVQSMRGVTTSIPLTHV